MRLSKRDRHVQLTVDLTEVEIAAIEASEMAPDQTHSDAELYGKHAAG